jgi:uncharacterized protein (DUF924 family)
MNDRIDTILSYWFDGLNDDSELHMNSPQFQRWFGKDEAADREIRERFEDDHKRAAANEYSAWENDPRGRLALIVLLDQFPRNMYRDTSRMFETDPAALSLTLGAIKNGQDRELSLVQRMFLYMPLMHAESRSVQEIAVKFFTLLVELAEKRSPGNVKFFALSRDYAYKHKEIIDRFGHYPHRNKVLGRESTPEEVEFLKGPDSSF